MQAASTPAQHPAANPAIAMRNGARHREHDADNQSGLEHLAKNNDQGSQHGGRLYCTVSAPRAFSLKSS